MRVSLGNFSSSFKSFIMFVICFLYSFPNEVAPVNLNVPISSDDFISLYVSAFSNGVSA